MSLGKQSKPQLSRNQIKESNTFFQKKTYRWKQLKINAFACTLALESAIRCSHFSTRLNRPLASNWINSSIMSLLAEVRVSSCSVILSTLLGLMEQNTTESWSSAWANSTIRWLTRILNFSISRLFRSAGTCLPSQIGAHLNGSSTKAACSQDYFRSKERRDLKARGWTQLSSTFEMSSSSPLVPRKAWRCIQSRTIAGFSYQIWTRIEPSIVDAASEIGSMWVAAIAKSCTLL